MQNQHTIHNNRSTKENPSSNPSSSNTSSTHLFLSHSKALDLSRKPKNKWRSHPRGLMCLARIHLVTGKT